MENELLKHNYRKQYSESGLDYMIKHNTSCTGKCHHPAAHFLHHKFHGTSLDMMISTAIHPLSVGPLGHHK